MEYLISWVVVKVDGKEVVGLQVGQDAEAGDVIEVTINEGATDCKLIEAEFVREIGTSKPL